MGLHLAAPAGPRERPPAPDIPARYQHLLASIDEGFCILEKVDATGDTPMDFRIVETNPAFNVHSGFVGVNGRTLQEVVPSESKAWIKTYETVLATGEPIRFERDLVTTGRKLELHAFRIDDAARRSVGVIFTEITGRKHVDGLLRDSEERYRRLFESAKDGILILDFATGTIIDANPFMTDLLGYSNAELTGKELWQIGLFADRAGSEAAVRQLQENGYIRFENLPLESSRGRTIEVDIVGNAYREHHHKVIQCNIRDISERCALERTTLAHANALAAIDRRKDEFLAMLSHELRAPLAPIVNAVQILRLQENEGLVERQACLIIERQVGQIKHLIDDLLEVSRITNGKVHFRSAPVTFNAIVELAVEAVRPLIDWRRHQFSLTLPPEPIWVIADAGRLEQAVVNLLTNAAKYTDEGGHVWVSLDRDGDFAVLRVRDDGVGISAELLPHVFDLFTQEARSLDRAQGGLGIGLSLVRRLVELHGGTVVATSTPGLGSEFVVSLPVTVPAAAAGPPIAQVGKVAQGCRVLIVDDSVDTTHSLSLLLSTSGYEVRTAHDGPGALEALAREPADVVLMDIGLPGMDGFEVARRIRRQPASDRVVLVAMTGYGQERDRQMAREAGFDHHLVKPADFDELLGILAEATSRLAPAH